MTTERQIEANRRNAEHSTGPRTEEGKAKSARNSLKHGLYSQDIVVEHPRVGEDPQEYDALHTALRLEYSPQGPLQQFLVQRIAVHTWRLMRAARWESARISAQVRSRIITVQAAADRGVATEEEIDERALEYSMLEENESRALLKYEAQQEAGLHRSVKALRELQREQAQRNAPAKREFFRGKSKPIRPRNQPQEPAQEEAAEPRSSGRLPTRAEIDAIVAKYPQPLDLAQQGIVDAMIRAVEEQAAANGKGTSGGNGGGADGDNSTIVTYRQIEPEF